MKNIEVKKTTYKVDGCTEPCFEVTNGFVMIRIAPFYHYIGNDTILITEYHDGEFASREEWDIPWDYIGKPEAVDIAKRFSVYL